MRDGIYQFIVGALDLFLWSGELVGEENLPRRGPAVFIANHLDATGPIAAASSIPLRLHPWVIADMMDKEIAPPYLQWDFVERQLHFKPPLSIWISRFLCGIAVPLFYSLGCIPVYRGDYERMRMSLHMSMDVLRRGQFLLVFPEDNRLPTDPLTKMQPFQHSFVRLGEIYFEETGNRLEFFPVTIHSSGVVIIGKAVAYNPLNPVGVERRRLKDLLEDTIIATYLKVDGSETSSVLTPERK
jgi:hypothetical protein